jgi:hypothetical protein
MVGALKEQTDVYLNPEPYRRNEMLGKYVIIRTYSAGVHAGVLKSRNGKEVVLENARRLWYWDGAASLSQLAVDGVSRPNNCKFPCEVAEILLTEAIEIIPVTEKARVSIASVSIWKN